MDTLALILASGIVGLVFAQLGLHTYSSVLEIANRRAHRELEQRLLRDQIEATKTLRSQRGLDGPAWNGYRKFVVDQKVTEAAGICSFYLVPHDGKPLPSFKPGQYLTFRLDVPERDKPVIRCYSLSDGPGKDYYRVSIKRVSSPPEKKEFPPGVCSNYFHDHVKSGDILDVKAPAGHFVLDLAESKPAVLIAGGIGVTPMISMLNAVVASNRQRDVWVFHGVRHGGEHAFREHVTKLAGDHDNIRAVVCYSEPQNQDVQGTDYDCEGHVSLDLLSQHLQTSNYQFFLCGPPPMMESLTRQLKQWGVPHEDIRTEAFGPASVKAKRASTPKTLGQPATPKATFSITFAKTGRQVPWDENASNILEFSKTNGVTIDSACCAGGCGTCQVAVVSGEVDYDDEPECEVESGCCLTCIGRPKGDLVLDA